MTSECCKKRVICKTWTGFSAVILANSADPNKLPQNAASDQGMHCAWITGTEGLNETVLSQSPFRTHSETIDPSVLSVLWLYTNGSYDKVSYIQLSSKITVFQSCVRSWCIYTNIRTLELLTLQVVTFAQVYFATCRMSTNAGWVANSVDPD